MALRDEIANWFMHKYDGDNDFVYNESYDDLAYQILALIEPELKKARILNDKIGHLVGTDIAVLVEKARKWGMVVKLAEYEKKDCRDDKCPVLESCRHNMCLRAADVIEFVDALAGKEEGDENNQD